jgi:hypothetical protein
LDCDKKEFIINLQKEMKKQDNEAVTTLVLNLIDEVELDLIEKDEAYNLAKKIVKECNSYPIKKLLDYWIDYFIGLN